MIIELKIAYCFVMEGAYVIHLRYNFFFFFPWGKKGKCDTHFFAKKELKYVARSCMQSTKSKED